MPAQLATWLAKPFDPDNMSAARWFLLIGLVVVCLWGWHQIFRELAEVEGQIA
jgi:hypothetical protein